MLPHRDGSDAEGFGFFQVHSKGELDGIGSNFNEIASDFHGIISDAIKLDPIDILVQPQSTILWGFLEHFTTNLSTISFLTPEVYKQLTTQFEI